MGKFEKNSTGFVLVKLTLRIFNSCLGHVTLKSRDRLDKLMVLFVIRRMFYAVLPPSNGVPSSPPGHPFFPACKPGC